MKLIITILLFSYNSYATQYYVSLAGGGTGTGLSEANSWSWAYYNANLGLLAESDDVSFKRGDVYYGTLIIASGTVGNRGTTTAYGTGANPLFTGMTELTSWTLSSGNIYYATVDVARLNIVTLDGVIQKMGRYPNTGYLNYESHTANTSITDNQLTGTPSWVGGEVVIRKYRWITDRHNITAHSTTTLTYDALVDWGNNNAYSPQDGNGYFIQSDLDALDLEGEWYYDNVANRLYMHFGAGTYSGRTVKAATIAGNSITTASGTTFNDIDFEGSNLVGADLSGKTYVTFNNCNFKWISAFGAYFGGACSNIVINGGDITDCLDNGIWFAYDISLITIDGVTLTNIGMIPGAGMSGDGHGQGIFVTTYLGVTSPNVIIKNCSVTNSGYIGIGFQGDNILIEKNFIDNFGSVKDDGGGIYTVMNTGETRVNRIVRNNIIINAIGAFEGVESYSYEAYGKEAGIYLDDYSNNVTVENNIIAHGEWNGIMTNAGSPNTITGNLVYDFPQCIAINSYAAGAIRDEVITGNTLIAKAATQKTLHILLSNANDDISLFGTINNNYYARPIDDNLTIGVDRQYSGGGGLTNYSLAGWQSLTGHDAASSKSLYTIVDEDDFRFDYNWSASPVDVTLTGSWKDIQNNIYTDPLTLSAYEGKVLMNYSAPSGNGSIYITPGGKILINSNGKILVSP